MSQPPVKLSEIPPGCTKHLDVGGIGVVLCNVEGTLYAIEDVCTHDGGPLGDAPLDGARIMCPRHGALFDVRSGAALTLPAIVPLPTYPVRIAGDEVTVEV